MGVPEEALTGKHGPCPLCGGKDRFRFDDKLGNGTWFCNCCKAGDGMQLVMKFRALDFGEAARLVEQFVSGAALVDAGPKASDEKQKAALNGLWRSSTVVAKGDPADLYLTRRGLGRASYPRVLRFAPRVYYRDEDEPRSVHPAMLAMLQDVDGKAVNLHRTYLTVGGEKAAVDSVRKIMSGLLPDGAAIRLSEYDSVLGIAESIENAMSATSLFGIPCWSAVSAAGFSNWASPADVTEVVIFGDNDFKHAGQAAAYALAHRLACNGLTVRVEIPTTVGADWNDVLLKRRKPA